MNRKTRLMILLLCVVCFFAIAPVLVAYSMGYRFDFEKMEIVGTGGIYVRTFPTAEQVVIDSNISAKPGVFSNAVFTQSLLPKSHTVLVKKDGYYDYFKTLPVQEKAVTKLENVILFKKSLTFNLLSDEVGYFSIAPDNQNALTAGPGEKAATLSYFNLDNNNSPQKISAAGTGKILDIKWSDDSSSALIKTQLLNEIFYYFFDSSASKPIVTRLPYLDKNSQQIFFNPRDSKEIFYEENNVLYSLKNNAVKTVIKGLIAYHFSGENIIWLSLEGILRLSEDSGELINNLSVRKYNVNSGKNYEVLLSAGKTFLRENNLLFLFNAETKIFENFYVPGGDFEISNSPDNKNLFFISGNEIYLYSFSDEKNPLGIGEKIFSGANLSNGQWLNNNYLIFTSGNEIIISEIDSRGNINAVSILSELSLANGKTLEVNNPKTFFIPQTGKIYILSENTLVASEKITP